MAIQHKFKKKKKTFLKQYIKRNEVKRTPEEEACQLSRWVSETTQQLKWIPSSTWWKERIKCHRLSPDFHMGDAAAIHVQYSTHTVTKYVDGK